MENDDDIVEDKNVTEADTGDLDIEDNIIDDKNVTELDDDLETHYDILENKNASELDEESDKIQHINDDDFVQMCDSLKALEGHTNIQNDISPKQLRWDTQGMGMKKVRTMTLKMKMISMRSLMKRRNLILKTLKMMMTL